MRSSPNISPLAQVLRWPAQSARSSNGEFDKPPEWLIVVSGLTVKKLSHAKSLGLGLSVAILSTEVSPFIAKAQTVNFGAATVGKLSKYCRGDGSDESARINKCLSSFRQ